MKNENKFNIEETNDYFKIGFDKDKTHTYDGTLIFKAKIDKKSNSITYIAEEGEETYFEINEKEFDELRKFCMCLMMTKLNKRG